MIQFTQSELHDTLQQCLQNQQTLLSEGRAAVNEWKYANQEMFGLFPWFAQIACRGPQKWEHANREWLSEKPSGLAYRHGLDAQGKVRILERTDGMTTLYSSTDYGVDQIVFGGMNPILYRWIIAHDQTLALYSYHLDPHQYSYETFSFQDGKCVESYEQSWYIKNGQWVAASSTTICRYEYDMEGLVRAYRDMGKRLGGNTLVYVRPKLKKSSKEKAVARRRFFAYTLSIDTNADADAQEQSVYADAYGLEMNLDEQWPIDTVLLTPPELFQVVTEQTNLQSLSNVGLGVSSCPGRSDLRTVKSSGIKWILLDASDTDIQSLFSAVIAAKLHAILLVSTHQEVATILGQAKKLAANRLVIAVRAEVNTAPETVQATAADIRRELHTFQCADARIVIASPLDKDQIMGFKAMPDIDGVFDERGNFARTIELLIQLAVHC